MSTPLTTGYYLTIADLAERYHVSVRTVESWRYQRRGPRGTRFGRTVRFHIDDVLKWEEQRREES